MFDFLGTNFFDVSVGESALEPIQLAVRSVIERATLEMITRIYRAPGGSCSINLGTSDDPLRDYGEQPYYPAQVAYAAPYPAPYAPAPYAPYPQPVYYAQPTFQATYSDAGRGRPYGGYAGGAPGGMLSLRGGL